MTLRTTSAHWIIHDGIGSGLWSLRQLPCDYRALVQAGLSRPQRKRGRENREVPFSENEKIGKRKNTPKLPTLRKTQMSSSHYAFFPRFLTSLPHLKFYRSYWWHPTDSECFSNIRDWILRHDKCKADKSCSLFTSRFQTFYTWQKIRYITPSRLSHFWNNYTAGV